jgi:hypothetical protein
LSGKTNANHFVQVETVTSVPGFFDRLYSVTSQTKHALYPNTSQKAAEHRRTCIFNSSCLILFEYGMKQVPPPGMQPQRR